MENMDKIRIGVVGAGYLGKFHLQKLGNLECAQLIGVCDTDPLCRQILTENYRIPVYDDYKKLLGSVDAVTVVTPTLSHFEIAQFFLEQGVHVFVEKPITVTLEQADFLVAIAKRKSLILQCGHIERFNPAFQFVLPQLLQPSFIESHRLAPYKARGQDVSVVLDLMIHDIDIILSVVKSRVLDLQAVGAAVLADSIDVAHVRILFEDGCVASMTASRVDTKEVRNLRIFQHNACFDVDMYKMKCRLQKNVSNLVGNDNVISEEVYLERTDALKDELEAFLKAIIVRKPPLVSGVDGRNALALAERISKLISSNSTASYDDYQSVVQKNENRILFV